MYAERLLLNLTVTSALPDESAVLRYMGAAIEGLPEISHARFVSGIDEASDVAGRVTRIPVSRGGAEMTTLQILSDNDLPSTLVDELTNTANLVALEISRRRLQHDMEAQIAERTSQVATLLERFEIASSATGIGLWEWNPQTDKLEWDDRMHEIFDTSPASFSGKYEDWRKLVVEDDLDGAERSLQKALETGENFESMFRIRTREGIKHLKGAAKAIYDNDGQPVRVIGTNFDVSEIYELNDQLRQAQRLESIGQLTGGIAHDMNNILGAIVGNADLLLTLPAVAADAEARKLTETVISVADRGQSLTSRLLAFARRDHLNPDDIEVGQVLTGLSSILKPTLAGNIYLSMTFEPKLPPIRVDQHQFENSVLNLVINSRDAMPEGGDIRISSTFRSLDDEAQADRLGVAPGQYVEVTVADSGEGMPPAFLDHVIEPFFTTKAPGEGTGLGLSMVHGFVLQSGGQLSIDSTEGEGTTVSMLFPVSRRDEARAVESQQKATVPSEDSLSGCVLLIEDDEAISKIAGKFLESFGLSVIKAADGETALSLFEDDQDRIDIVLTDIALAGPLNGFQVADQIQGRRPDIPVVFSSGYPEAFERSGRELDRGANFLQKPYRRAALYKLVANRLGGAARSQD